MTMRRLPGCVTAMLSAVVLNSPPQAAAAEKIVIGAVASPSTLYWPLYIIVHGAPYVLVAKPAMEF